MSWIAKRLVLNIIIASCLTNVECEKLGLSYTKFQDLQKHAPSLKHLAEFIDSANWNQLTPHHNVVRRQTTNESMFTEEDVRFCSKQLMDIYCSTGILKGLIDAELICSRDSGIEQAQRDANACARNKHGEYCYYALLQFEQGELGLTISNIRGNCSRVVSSGNSCPTACRTQLEHIRSTLGCCIDAHINSSTNSDYRAIIFDYHLWNLCDIPLPTEGCDNGPVISHPVNVRKCTAEEFYNQQYIQNICLPQRGQPYINAIVLSSRCNEPSFLSMAKTVVDFCSVNANGYPCWTDMIQGRIQDIKLGGSYTKQSRVKRARNFWPRPLS